MSLPTLCIQRPVMTTALDARDRPGRAGWISVPAGGGAAKVDFPTISVSTSMRARAYHHWRRRSRTPLEKEFSAIAGVDSITSVSGLGVPITVQFNLNRQPSTRPRRIFSQRCERSPENAGRDDHPAVLSPR